MEDDIELLAKSAGADGTKTSLTPRVDELDYNQEIKSYRIWDLARALEIELSSKTNEVARLREENAELKQGKVFVDPKWIYNLETQLAKAHEELCQAGLRKYGI
jgi:hypothetical protein